MKIKIITTTIIILLITMNAYAECVIRLRVREAPPAYFIGENGDWTGFVVEQAKAILRDAGCDVVYVEMPWKRALFSLEEGDLDMLGNMSITEERRKYTNFIGPHRFERMRIIVKDNSDYQIEKHEDLRDIPGKISLVRGLWYGEKIEDLLKDQSFLEKINWVSGNKLVEQEIERLKLGRVKAVIYPEFFIKDMSEVKYHSFIINSNPVYFGLSKKSVNSSIKMKLEKSATELLDSGELEKIESKFH